MTHLKKLTLISAKLCPFVQRSSITLLAKNIPFDIQYIELDNKPDWFLKVSPFGKVPLLKVEDTVLFESNVILEYLDEISPPSMHPSDPLLKAQNRGDIELSSSLIMNQFMLWNAKDEASFEEIREKLRRQLEQIESRLGSQSASSRFYNGDKLSLIDCCFAPAFTRFALLNNIKPLGLFANLPRIKAWADELLALNAVKKSVVPEFDELFIAAIKKKSGYIASFI